MRAVFDFFSKFFGVEKSGNVAKERLKLVLIHDRNDISPEVLEHIKVDMILTLKKYLEIDESGIDMQLDRQSRSVALVANIPLKSIRTQTRGRAADGEKNTARSASSRGQAAAKGTRKKNV